jgi:hypothetical protein
MLLIFLRGYSGYVAPFRPSDIPEAVGWIVGFFAVVGLFWLVARRSQPRARGEDQTDA